jgi:hypothetical protein
MSQDWVVAFNMGSSRQDSIDVGKH